MEVRCPMRTAWPIWDAAVRLPVAVIGKQCGECDVAVGIDAQDV